jgi:glycosyltransferase involved in cell wall biosynthesis
MSSLDSKSAEPLTHGGAPLVSIGMPLYNSAQYVREALEALLAQDYPNFELVISDNASTDATEDICREYAARDERIRYVRADINMGAVWNFRRVFELARGEYFMWAAFDDLRAPQYLSRCVEALEAHPQAVMCCTDIQIIDEDGEPVQEADFPLGIRMSGREVWQRVSAISRSLYWYDFYGLMRRSVLAATRLPRLGWGFDVILMMEMGLRGEVLLVPEKLFFYRIIKGKTGHQTAAILGPVNKARAPLSMNWGGMIGELWRSIWLSPLPRMEKLTLALPFFMNFCVHNPVVRMGLYKEGLSGVAHAWRNGQYGLSLGLLLLAAVVIPVEGVYSLFLRPLRYRHAKTESL